MKIIDQLVDDEYFHNIQGTTMGYHFPWYFNAVTTSIAGDSDFMFTHIALSDEGAKSGFFPVLEPMIQAIHQIEPFKQVLRVKLNLYTNQGRQIHHEEHLDQEQYGPEEVIVGLYSINTCNGGTVVGDQSVAAVGNRLVLFDNGMHHGFTQTDTQVRACINFNFLK